MKSYGRTRMELDMLTNSSKLLKHKTDARILSYRKEKGVTRFILTYGDQKKQTHSQHSNRSHTGSTPS